VAVELGIETERARLRSPCIADRGIPVERRLLCREGRSVTAQIISLADYRQPRSTPAQVRDRAELLCREAIGLEPDEFPKLVRYGILAAAHKIGDPSDHTPLADILRHLEKHFVWEDARAAQ